MSQGVENRGSLIRAPLDLEGGAVKLFYLSREHLLHTSPGVAQPLSALRQPEGPPPDSPFLAVEENPEGV